MMNPLIKKLIVTSSLYLFALPIAHAHHSFGAEFEDKAGEINGIITKVRFSNPHPRYSIEVSLPDGSVEEWELQGQSITNLRAGGWDRDFVQAGDVVRVWGSLGRNGTKKLFVRGLEKDSGELYDPSQRAKNRPDPTEVNATPDKNYSYGQLNTQAPFDISGPWRNSYKFRVTVNDMEPKPTPFTAEAKTLYDAIEHYDDHSLRCISPGLPRVFGAPYDMDIVDAGSHYQFVYIDHNTPRRIYMDGRSKPANFPETAMGWSLGHWDGEELVIETTKLISGWLDGSGMPFHGGDDTRITERYTFAPNKLSMDRVMTVYDSYYTEPLVRRRASARDDNVVIMEQESCDPSSYYNDILKAGELEQRLDGLL